jgi:hypothetical protein
MVEKVSEVSIKTALNMDSSADDCSLLEWIDKKKRQKQVGEHMPSGMTVSSEMLIRLINAPTAAEAGNGGLQKTEQQPSKQSIPAAFGSGVNSLLSDKGDSLRQQVRGAAAVQPASVSGTIQAKPTVAQAEMPNVGKSKTADAVSKTEPLSAAIPVAKHQPITTTAPPVTQRLVNLPAVATTGKPQPVATEQRQQRKEEAGEVKPLLYSGKLQEFTPPQQSEVRMQNKNVPTTLQQLKTQASAADPVAKPGAESQTLEVDYSFQRWSGDHSVKISVPTQALREGNITLLPSDARAADMLSRNMGHLTGLTPELLQPQRDRDEQQQQRRQQPQQDEDQE